MHLRNVDLNLLESLYALLVERHVTRAAKRCCLSQPAMSRSLERLREMFGDELLIRAGRAYERTARGEELLRELETLLPRLEALVRGVPFDPLHSRETVRVALTDYAAAVVLPALAQRIRSDAPNMTLEIVAWHDLVYEDLEAGKIDLALTPVAAPLPLEAEILFEESFICLFGPQRKAPAHRFTLKEYLELPHAVVSVLAAQQTLVDRPLAELGLKRRVGLSVPFFIPAVVTAASTDLIVTVPSKLAKALAGIADIRAAEPPPEIKGFPYLMMWHPRQTSELAHEWLREQLRAIARIL